jgi:soluble lytic murein transglycosylase-like protein
MTSAAAGGDIYGYTDGDGVTHLSNVADDGPYKLMLRNPKQYRLRSGSVQLPRNAPFANAIRAAADASGLEPALIDAVITVESNHDPGALSPKGAMGLMQLMPETSRRFGVANPWHPAQNIRAGARYLSELLVMFDDNLPLALAAYNAGERTVIRYGRQVPPFPETKSYVKRVMTLYRQSASTKAATGRSRKLRAM